MKVFERMVNKRVSLITMMLGFLLLSSSVFLLFTELSEAAGAHIYVKNTYAYDNGDGSANRPYRFIQKAIDLAQDGDSIFVFEGIYNETLSINKRINISGLDRKNTTIQKGGGSYRYLIDITADNVALEDLNISDVPGSIRTALIHITSENVRIVGTRVTQGKKWGIYLDGSSDGIIGFSSIDNMSDIGIRAENSDNNVFSNNYFNKNKVASLYLSSCDNAIIYNNTIKRNNISAITGNGIDGQYCSNVNISGNAISNCSLDGVHLFGGQSNLIQKNIIKYCDRQGIYISSSGSNIFNNNLTYNTIGVSLSGSTCQVKSNVIKNSAEIGLIADIGTHDNIIALNQFLLNSESGKERGSNQWDNQDTGNYWSDYNEGDRDLNGIGDVPYTRMGGIDHYPTGKFLKPPNKPEKPAPSDGKDNVGLSVTLNVTVSDPDSDTLYVRFYNASDNSLISNLSGIKSGRYVLCRFTLPFETTFSWYAVVSDWMFENRSDIWFFTTRQIPPTNQKPIANPGGPYSIKLEQILTFDGSASMDPDGRIIFYRWNFGDGSSEILGNTPKHTYIDPGTYTATLTVVDNSGRSAIANTTVAVSGDVYINSPPSAFFISASSVSVGQQVLFDASGSNDTDGTVVSYRWDFDSDGSFETDWLTNTTTTYTFSTAGTVVVTLEAKDDANTTGSYAASIVVNAAQKKTPGFEILLMLLAMLVCFFMYRKMKR